MKQRVFFAAILRKRKTSMIAPQAVKDIFHFGIFETYFHTKPMILWVFDTF